MLKPFGCVVLVSAVLGLAQPPKSIALTDKSNVPAKDILKALQKECPNVNITNDTAKSDYKLEARRKINSKGIEEEGVDLTVFDSDGKAVFNTSNLLLNNAVKSVCHAINGTGNKK